MSILPITYNWLLTYTERILAHGKHSFSLVNVKHAFPQLSDSAIRSSLKRLASKGKIISWSNGYYLIISPEYAQSGILPATLFVDDYMTHLNRWYYVGLLNAAAYHGASHQQPQDFFLVTRFPVIRPIQKNNFIMNFISTNPISESLIEQRKTESGYIRISNPALTACDLIQYEKRIGGLTRASSVISELSECIQWNSFSVDLIQAVPIAVLQRLGYLLEYICNESTLSDALYSKLRSLDVPLFRVPLKTSKASKGFSSTNRWNIIVNVDIEIEDSV